MNLLVRATLLAAVVAILWGGAFAGETATPSPTEEKVTATPTPSPEVSPTDPDPTATPTPSPEATQTPKVSPTEGEVTATPTPSPEVTPTKADVTETPVPTLTPTPSPTVSGTAPLATATPADPSPTETPGSTCRCTYSPEPTPFCPPPCDNVFSAEPAAITVEPDTPFVIEFSVWNQCDYNNCTPDGYWFAALTLPESIKCLHREASCEFLYLLQSEPRVAFEGIFEATLPPDVFEQTVVIHAWPFFAQWDSSWNAPLPYLRPTSATVTVRRPGPSPTPSLTPSPSLTDSPTPSLSPSPSDSPTPSAFATASESPSPSPSESPTPSAAPTASATGTPTVDSLFQEVLDSLLAQGVRGEDVNGDRTWDVADCVRLQQPFATPVPSATPTESPSPTLSETPTDSPSPSASASPSDSPTASASPSESPTESATPSTSPSPSISPTASPSPTASRTPTPTPTFTPASCLLVRYDETPDTECLYAGQTLDLRLFCVYPCYTFPCRVTRDIDIWVTWDSDLIVATNYVEGTRFKVRPLYPTENLRSIKFQAPVPPETTTIVYVDFFQAFTGTEDVLFLDRVPVEVRAVPTPVPTRTPSPTRTPTRTPTATPDTTATPSASVTATVSATVTAEVTATVTESPTPL